MSTTPRANIDIAAALAEAQELYRALNPKSLAQYEAACAALDSIERPTPMLRAVARLVHERRA